MTHVSNYRYYLDLRIGCCGIIDTKIPYSGTQCLNSDIPNVIFFWEGSYDVKSECWYVPLGIESKATKICLLLNEIERIQNAVK